MTRAELEACECEFGVAVGEGDIFVFRTGHHRRRLELGAWDNGYAPGEGKPGLHGDTIPWMHVRTVPGCVVRVAPAPGGTGSPWNPIAIF